jgi:hypothetical protein
MKLFLCFSILLFAGCKSDTPKTMENFKSKKSFEKSDLSIIIDEEYKLARAGLVLFNQDDSMAMKRVNDILDQIKEWDAIREERTGGDLVTDRYDFELTKDELRKWDTIMLFRQKWIDRLRDVLNNPIE